MSDWEQDKRWSDKFLHEIKRILGQHLIGQPPAEEDQARNTDIMVLRMDAVRIACRVRKQSQIRYVDQFTIRSGRPSGVKTELTKIIEGWGDYFFYAFSTGDERALDKWILGDLKAFRIWHARETVRLKGNFPGEKLDNHDGSSCFRVYNWRDIPDFVIANNHPEVVELQSDEAWKAEFTFGLQQRGLLS